MEDSFIVIFARYWAIASLIFVKNFYLFSMD